MRLKIIKNMWLLMIVLIIVTLLTSSPEIHYRINPESFYYCIPIDRNEPKEHHPDSPEEEKISVFEMAGTYYGKAIGAELIYPDEAIGGEFV